MASGKWRLHQLLIAVLVLLPASAWAGGNGPILAVPALDEFGLLGLAAALGAAGAFALWRRKK